LSGIARAWLRARGPMPGRPSGWRLASGHRERHRDSHCGSNGGYATLPTAQAE